LQAVCDKALEKLTKATLAYDSALLALQAAQEKPEQVAA
jgi:hypothetical protein